MFDIGFWELILVGVVALIVVGPERLPGLARTVGLWVGRARRFVSTVKADVERETRQEELQKILNKQNEFRSAYEIVEETRDTLKETGDSVRESTRPTPEQGPAPGGPARRDEDPGADDAPGMDDAPEAKADPPAQADHERDRNP